MKKIFYTVTLSLIFSLFYNHTYASHAMGADISYECLGNGQYRIIYQFYRDCSGISSPTSIPVTITSSCGGTQSLTLTQDPLFPPIEVSNLCTTAPSTCAGGTNPGVQRYTYTATITLVPGCIYTVGYAECCRNTSSNIASSQSLDLYVNTTINTNNALCNNGPRFTSYPVPYYCVNQAYSYSHGTVEIDGDSLVYTLVPPLDALGVPAGYTPPFSVTNPMPTATGFVFNSQTGQFNFTPTTPGFYVIAIQVDEYRNGVLIGTTMRDIQIVVINCNNIPPVVFPNITTNNSSGGLVVNNSTLGICPGTTATFNIVAFDPTGQPITVTSNIATSMPGATLVTTPINGRNDSVRITFTWSPSPADSGFRNFTMTISDNVCPVPGNQIYTYNITVLRGVSLGPDKGYCPVGGPVTVNAQGASRFRWTTLAGGPPIGMVSSNLDSTIVQFAPSVTTTYIAIGNLQGGCKDRDTITIIAANDFFTSLTASDDTICKNATSTLTLTPSPLAEGPFTYTWFVNGVRLDTAITTNTRVVKPLVTTTYRVEVTSRDLCFVRKDSITIVVSGIGPKVEIFANKNFICPGDTINLTSRILDIECGLTPGGLGAACPGGSQFQNTTIGAGTGTSTVAGPYRNFWHDGRTQYLFRASELQALGMQAGTITDLSVFVATKGSTVPFNGFTIKMGCTSLNSLTTFVEGLSVVANPIPYTTIANSWNSHTFDNPYDWDGLSNIIVEMCFDNTTFAGTNDAVRITNAFAGATIYRQVDGQVGCTLTAPVSLTERPNILFGSCIPPVSGYNYTWTPSTPDISCTNCPNPQVVLSGNTRYQLVVDNGFCNGDTVIDLAINPNVSVTAGQDVVTCGQAAQLNVAPINPVTPVCIPNYSLASIPYSAKTAVSPTTVVFNQNCSNGLDHERFAGPVTLPFPFQFYCNTYNQINITQNGYVTFNPTTCVGTPQALPNANTPNNLIALCYADLSTAGFTGGAGSVEYFTTGVAPNRVFTIRYNNVQFLFTTNVVRGEIQLYETTNVVEVHTFLQNRTTANKVQGIENSTGTAAVTVTGRNNQNWSVTTTPDAYRFTPQYNGAFPIAYTWSPSIGLSDSSIFNPAANPVGATCYEAKVTYNNGCVTRDTVCVTLSTFPYTLTVSPDSVCPGGTAQLSLTGPGVTYTWSPANQVSDPSISNPTATVINTTQFNVTASNIDGCVVRDSITLYTFAHPPVNLPGDRSICSTDSFLISPNGGPYTDYEWYNLATGNTIISTQPSIYAFPGNSYFVKVRSAGSSCFYFSDTFDLSAFALSPITAVGAATICDGDSVVLQANAGLTNYQWNNSTQTQLNVVRTAGIYFYTANDANGCLLSSDTAVVNVDANPVINFNQFKNPICPGDVITINAGLESGVIYTWTPGGVADSISVNTAGVYEVIANRNGCIRTDQVVINAATPPVVILPADTNVCSCNFSKVVTPFVQSTSGVTYEWSTNSIIDEITVTTSGTYEVTVTDGNNCTASATQTFGVYCLNVEARSDASSVNLGDSTRLNGVIINTNYTPNPKYEWTPDSSVTNPDAQTTWTRPSSTTTYVLKLEDQTHGCVAFDTITIGVVPPGLYGLPNAFTPNGDGQNDFFYPFFPPGSSAYVSELRIYNRWGQLVYSGLLTPGWDGNVGGQPAPMDTYTYYIQVTVPDASQPSGFTINNVSGTFALLR